jgi:hypothetical protein
MIRSFLRSALAVLVGLLVGFLVVAGGEMIGHHLSPPPPGVDPSKPESIAAVMEQMPAAAFAPLLIAWAAGTFAGAWVAARIASRWKLGHGMIVGDLFFAATVAILMMMPHPAWVVVAGLSEVLAFKYLGATLASRDRTPPALAA